MMETTALDVLDILYRALKQARADVTMDNDHKDGEIILTTEDGKEWVIRSNDIEELEE